MSSSSFFQKPHAVASGAPSGAVYAASRKCTIWAKGKPCSNLAMYTLGSEWSCTRHAFCKQSKTYGVAEELPPMPEEFKRERLKGVRSAHQKSIQEAEEKNQREGKEGTVDLYKIPFIRNVELKDGFEDVYPNIKEKTHLSGVHMSSLSPMNSWTVHHGQPGIPPATSIENFHQQSKRYHWESAYQFVVNRFHGYRCSRSYRHKQPEVAVACLRDYLENHVQTKTEEYKELNPMYQTVVKKLRTQYTQMSKETDKEKRDMDVEMKIQAYTEEDYDLEYATHKCHGGVNMTATTNKFACEYAVWVDSEGKEIWLGAVEARQLYCHFFQEYVESKSDFDTLVEWKKKGKNIRICGFDAHPTTIETVEKDYLDASKPFGHELVLWTMLMVKNKNDWPWIKHRNLVIPANAAVLSSH